jgi:hypothetical protein
MQVFVDRIFEELASQADRLNTGRIVLDTIHRRNDRDAMWT